jgi:hypothetical protein
VETTGKSFGVSACAVKNPAKCLSGPSAVFATIIEGRRPEGEPSPEATKGERQFIGETPSALLR